MPEMTFNVRWPDATESRFYSPSLVVREHLTAGQVYPVPDFVERVRTALTIASERVRAKHGFYCTRASAELEEVERRAAAFDGPTAGFVTVVGFDP